MPLTQRRDDELHSARERASARIDLRPKPDQKQLFKEAAALEGQTLTEFLLRSAEERARRVLHDHEALQLQSEASARFVQLLMNAPAPNARLRAAFERHDQEVESH